MEAIEAREGAGPGPGARARALVRLGLVGAALLTLLIGYAMIQSSRAPGWWREAGAPAPNRAELAERVERAVATELHRGRPDGEPWSIAITAEQANAWLADRLPMWLANRARATDARASDGSSDAQRAGMARVRFAPGRATGAFRPERSSSVLGLSIEPQVRADGSLWVESSAFRLGRLGVPSSWARSAARSRAAEASPRDAEAARKWIEALAGDSPLLPPGGFTLEDGRRVRLLGVRVEKDRLALTCVTERAAGRESAAR